MFNFCFFYKTCLNPSENELSLSPQDSTPAKKNKVAFTNTLHSVRKSDTFRKSDTSPLKSIKTNLTRIFLLIKIWLKYIL